MTGEKPWACHKQHLPLDQRDARELKRRQHMERARDAPERDTYPTQERLPHKRFLPQWREWGASVSTMGFHPLKQLDMREVGG